MKTIYKILAVLVALPIVAAFASCSKNNDEPEPAEKDYSVAIQYTGMFKDSDNADLVVTNITLGADVASARIGWCQGKASATNLAFVTEQGQLITKGGEWKLEFPKDALSGPYTVYAVSFDEKGNAKESAYEEFQYDASKEKDYSVAIQYTGMFTSSDNALMAVTNVTLGADVASARIGWCQGKASTAGLAFVTEKGQLITKGGEWKLEFPKDAMSGTYTVYAVSFDDKGNAKESAYEEFQYDAPKESWTPKYYGTWEFSLRAFRIDEGIPYYRSNLVISVCDQDGSKYKISNLWDGVDFFFTLKDNKVSFEDQFTGSDFGYGKLLISDLAKYPGYETYKGYLSGNHIYFGVYYVDDEYSWGYGFETLTLDKAYK